MLSDFHFLRPEFLWLFILLPILVVMLHRKARQSNSWLQVCDPKLVSHLLVGIESRASILPLILLIVVGSLIILALAGPAWQKLPQPVFQSAEARVYVLDLSRSMDATDIAPSRATRAKLKLIDFLRSHKEGQVGLIAFAGTPHIVSPLTDDSNTIISMVSSLTPEIMPVQGSKPASALQEAIDLLKQAGNPHGDIVLMTDGVDLDDVTPVARKMTSESYSLHVVGVGTAEGAPIPIGQGGFLKDNSGGIVIPKLDVAELKELALAGGGQYVTLSVDDRDVKKLSNTNMQNSIDKESDDMRQVDLWRDEGHWLLLAILPLAALAFRRGWLGVVVLAITFAPVEESLAFEWDDLWLRKDQQAEKLLQQGNAEAAAKLFENKQWQGTAHYRQGDYEQAAQAFANGESLEAQYNYATALAKQGKFQEAIEIYDQVLEQKPDHEDAMFNRELLKKAQQQEQQQQQGSDGEQQNQDQQNSQSSQEQQGDSQQQGQQSQENQQQDGQQGEQQESNQGEQQQAQDAAQQEKNQAQQSEEELRRQQEAEEGEQAERLRQQQETEQTSEEREAQQATEQWLRRIPDDPGGLMREKFYRESQRNRQRSDSEVEKPW